MFLVYFFIKMHIILHILQSILCFIEEHSVLVGVVSSLIVSSLWFKKFIKQRRAEAFFGFYARISLHIKILRMSLEEKGLLNVTEASVGNIYALIYISPENVCPGFNLAEEQMKSIVKITSELRKIILETNNNVYPNGSERKKWYDSQYKLLTFCEFVEKAEYHNTTNVEIDPMSHEYKHIVMCKQLISAMDYIQQSIDTVKY